MKKKSKLIFIIALICITILVILFQVFGIYVSTPFLGSKGETIIYQRRLVGTPFLSSADSLALSRGFIPNPVLRAAIDLEIRLTIDRHITFTLPYMDFLYLISTGNKNFLIGVKK